MRPLQLDITFYELGRANFEYFFPPSGENECYLLGGAVTLPVTPS